MAIAGGGMNGKIISADTLADVENWQLPEVDDGAPADACRPVTARQLEEIQQQAYAEGLEQGRQAGLQAGQREIASRVRELEALMRLLARPLEDLDRQVEEELVSLAMLVARQLVRRELKTDPGEILAVVREALALLPVAARNVRLHLHPEDAALVRETLSVNEAEQEWKIVEDPVLSRGGCKLSSDSSQIDATVENRLNAVIARVLGGERQGDA
ncbi:flagellar assembly protein FliH [Thiohalobacter sp. IOR34]|uniref:flagellar assembly protein FliH n=1 Tax=Thiohalobacter sp. IOR34 TaxID=3057176 RepID=UPI0025AF5002|nr:flagellar assembly protein FliH [Thiohalobacter sp. IOR34]WJW74573.1 flagellar assembly protein FliH [Thiohalobacter sp. IOR34]